MHINITSQIPALNEHLTALKDRLNGDLTPLMQAIGSVLENSTRQRFNTKKSPVGVSWAVLMPATLHTKHGRGGGILVDRGDLMRSITFHAAGDSVAVGTDREYGKYHQAGTKHMVARPFLGLSQQDEQDINDMINDFLAGAL